MSAMAIRPFGSTANDRLKQGFEARLALSFIVATLLHLLFFELWPTMEAPRWSVVATTDMDVVRPDEVDVPDTPSEPVRPSAPIIGMDVDATATIPTFDWSEVEELPPRPPTETPTITTGGMPFTPFTVGPALLNPREVSLALEREYPSILRDAGITGTVALLVHVDAAGSVLETRIGTSSGVVGLDEAALRVADVLRFRAALNRDTPVPVWIRLPITFRIR